MALQIFLLTDNTRIGTGIDDIVESFFANWVNRIDVTAQDFTVGQATACMLVVNAENLTHLVGITPADDFSPMLAHIRIDWLVIYWNARQR